MKIIKTRWLDINKGDDETMHLRSRWVGCEFAKEERNDLFAATPPLESLRAANSLAATSIEGMREDIRYPENEVRIQISFIDIDRAYFCAETNLEVVTCVKVPMKDPDHGRMCCLLLKHIYTAHEEQRMFGVANMPTYLRKRSSSRQAAPPLVSLTNTMLRAWR